MKTLAEIRKEREDIQARYQREKELKEATGVSGRVSILSIQADTGYAIRPITSLENTADLLYHMYNGDEFCKEICHEHYDGEKCPLCESFSTKDGKKRFATPTKFLLAHVYNLVGQEFDFEDKRTKERIQGVYNPLKLVGIPLGKKDCYIKPLIAANKRGEFMDSIFLIKRGNGTGWDVPEVITENELKDLLGNQVPLALPSEYAKYAEMDKRTSWKLMLTAMPGTRVDELLGPEPVKAADTAKSVSKNPFAVGAAQTSAVDIDSAFQ